jgi:hypothetical protein
MSRDKKSPPMSDKLWSMHISGMDEIYAMESEAEAKECASRFNDWFSDQPKSKNSPSCSATVQEWPYSPATHDCDLRARKAGRIFLPC